MNKLSFVLLFVCFCLNSCVNSVDSGSSVSEIDTSDILPDDTIRYVSIDTTYNLYIFYPDYKSIELQFDNLPVKGDDVLYAAPLAFTGSKAYGSGVVGGYCNDGVCYAGRCVRCNGCFYVTDKGFSFVFNKDWKSKPIDFFDAFLFEGIECGASQEMLVFNGVEVTHTRPNTNRHQFRALCTDSSGVLCIAESRKVVELGFFIKCLLAYKMKTALYMDMGGWNYACWRTKDDSLHISGKVNQTYSNMIVFKE